jgi:hypothetical protein
MDVLPIPPAPVRAIGREVLCEADDVPRSTRRVQRWPSVVVVGILRVRWMQMSDTGAIVSWSRSLTWFEPRQR